MRDVSRGTNPATHSAHVLVLEKCRELAQTVLALEPRLRIVLFGSRAGGAGRERSDFDIGFDAGHPLQGDVIGDLREAFDALPILESVDVVDLAAASESFRRVATAQEEVIYER